MSRAISRSRFVADHYLRLVREFPLRPIRTKADYRLAQKVMERLAVRDEGTLDPGEQDYLDMLSLAIEEYDRLHASASKPTEPVELLKFLMHENGMTVTSLGKLVGSKSLASQLLSRKRAMSKSVIAKLAARFKLDVRAFFQPE
jgi:HTH-type transcriptional regulator/antitoxin HigA